MFNDFELYSIHAEDAEIEKWYILSIKMDYIKYSRKVLLANRVKIHQTEENCEKE